MLMEKLHNASNSGVSKAIFALISVTFLVSGMAGYLGTRTDTSVVKVNGETVEQSVFQKRYSDEIERLTLERGSADIDNPEFTAALRERILNDLINQELIRQYAKQLKLSVSDEQIKQQIVSTPMFQIDGKFNNDAYQNVLRNNQMTPDMYAQYMREALILAQLQNGLGETSFITPNQANEFANLIFQQRQFRLAHLHLSEQDIAKQQVSAEEIETFYKQNKALFVQPEQLKVQYLDINPQLAEKAVTISEQQIAQYYQDNKEQFSTKGQDKVAHIQFATETAALDAYQALQQGANFAELAKKDSTDKLSGANGGDLGWLSAGDFPESFSQALQNLKVGEYSQPVKVDGNFHIIKLVDRKEGAILPLAQVKSQVEQAIRQSETSNKFISLEKKAEEKAFEDQSSLQTAAQAIGTQAKETDYFSKENIPAELNYPSVIQAMFNGEISQGGQNSDPMNVGELHSVMIRVLDHKPQVTRSLEESKGEIEQQLKAEKARSALLANAKEMVAQLNEGKAVNSLHFDKEQTWSYAQNSDAKLYNVIAGMKIADNRSAYQATQSGKDEIVVIALDKISSPDINDALRQQVSQTLTNLDQVDLQNNLLKSLRSKAKIELNDAFLRQVQE